MLIFACNLIFQVKWLEDKLNKITNERDYFRAQWEKLHHAAMASAAAARGSNTHAPNGSCAGQDLHSGMNAGQLDLSMTGAAAAAAAAAAHQQHERAAAGDPYTNGNDPLKLAPIR